MNKSIDDIDPTLPADRMVVSRVRTRLGIEIERKAYAFGNEYHDDYHIIERTFTNTGNIDEDDELELEGQTINEAYFFNFWRWTGRLEATTHGSEAQRWGKFNMIDVVGDGNEEYPVDFTSIYSWAGYDPSFSQNSWNNLGSPMIRHQETSAPTDTTGRLAGRSMQGLLVLHADNSVGDKSYDPSIQPKTLAFMDADDIFSIDGPAHLDFYELGILSRENPRFVSGGASRMYPHYADRIEPDGTFWMPTRDASDGKQGGFSATIAYGPYDMDVNDQVRIVDALVANGLSYDASLEIGRAYKQSGFDDEVLISYDANGDGVISNASFDYSQFDTGAELLTKNQWFLTSRDSMFKSMNLVQEIWDRSGEMTTYLFDAVPPPPSRFEVAATMDEIQLLWSSHSGEQDPVAWEIYRTKDYVDNVPYQLLNSLPGTSRSFTDSDVEENTSYYYYLVAVGESTTPDLLGISGTPSGMPFKSSRYYTQTFQPARLVSTVGVPPVGGIIEQNSPNPFDQATSIPFAVKGPQFVKITVFDLLGREVVTLIDQFYENDFADEIIWNGRDTAGRPVPSGIYFCQITTALGRDVISMIVAR